MRKVACWIIDVLIFCSLALYTKAVSVNNCSVDDNCRYCRDGAIVVEDSPNPSKLVYGGGHCVLNSSNVCVDIYTHMPCSGDASTCPIDALSNVMPEYLQPAWYQACGDQKRNYVMGPAGCRGGVDSIGTCTPQYGITTTTTEATTTVAATTTKNTTTTSNSTTKPTTFRVASTTTTQNTTTTSNLTTTQGASSQALTISRGKHAIAGYRRAVILQDDGSVHTVGGNTYGQLGDGSYTSKSVFAQVASNFVQFDTGRWHTLILKDDGSVHATGGGDANFGQLGDGTTINKNQFVQVIASGVSIVGAGSYFSIVLKNDGSVHATGQNSLGQLGDGTKTNRATFTQATNAPSDINSRATGSGHNLIIKNDGSLCTGGWNIYGALGDGTTTDRTSFTQVIANGVIAAIGGYAHSVVLKDNGSVHVAGQNDMGMLGDGTTTHKSIFTQVVASGVTAMSSKFKHTFILKDDGSVHATGWNHYGQLGDGTKTNKNTFSQLVDSGVIVIGAGLGISLIVKDDLSVYTLGWNYHGQLGDGTTTDRLIFTQVATLSR